MELQFENENSLRMYPLMEDATGTDDRGNHYDFREICGLSIVSHDKLEDVRISSVYVGPSLVSISISDSLGIVGSATSTEKTGVVALDCMRDGVSGVVEFYGVERDYTHPVKFDFSTTKQSGIDEMCIFELKRSGVEAFVDSSSWNEISGDVNIVFGQAITAGVDDNTVVLGVSKSAGAVVGGSCLPVSLSDSCIAPLVRTINGVAPNSDGEIAIVFE